MEISASNSQNDQPQSLNSSQESDESNISQDEDISEEGVNDFGFP